MRLGKAAGKRLWKGATQDFDFRRQEAEGVVDFARRRCMLDYGSYARLFAETCWPGSLKLKTRAPRGSAARAVAASVQRPT
jgi:hypothetical protein